MGQSQKAANLNSRMPALSYRFCCQMHLPSGARSAAHWMQDLLHEESP